jgi:hypothetical protein
MLEAESEESFVNLLSAHFAGNPAAHAVASALAPMFAGDTLGAPADAFGAYSEKGRWVIPDEDLKLADTLLRMSVVGGGAGFFVTHNSSATATVSAITGFVAAGIAFVLGLRKKIALLTEEQCVLVSLLRSAKTPLTADALVALLPDTPVVADRWEIARVERVLAELVKVRARSGAVFPVVAQDGGGRWGLCDI